MGILACSSRRRVRSPRSQLPARPPRSHGRRRARAGGRHPDRASRSAAGRRRAGAVPRRSRRSRRHRRRGGAGPARHRRVRHLHLRLDRPAQGVVVSHLQVARLLEATERWFGFDAADVWTCSIRSRSISRSGSCGARWPTAAAWWSALRGEPAPDAFYRLLAAERVTVLNQTPARSASSSRPRPRSGRRSSRSRR